MAKWNDIVPPGGSGGTAQLIAVAPVGVQPGPRPSSAVPGGSWFATVLGGETAFPLFVTTMMYGIGSPSGAKSGASASVTERSAAGAPGVAVGPGVTGVAVGTAVSTGSVTVGRTGRVAVTAGAVAVGNGVNVSAGTVSVGTC